MAFLICGNFLRHHLRWLILGISLIAFTILYANIMTFNFTVICMFRPQKKENGTMANKSTQNDDPKELFYYNYSVQQRNAFFSAPAIGAILNSPFIPHLIGHFGARIVVTFFGAISALSCVLMPLAVKLGFVPMFLLRIVQGTLYPVELIMISYLSREWSPICSISTYMLILSTQYQMGAIFTMPISGLLCESRFGWPSIYYFQSVITLFIFAIFFLIYRASPSEHPWISNKELHLIQANKHSIGVQTNANGNVMKKGVLKVPYRQILSDPIIWVVLLTFWTDDLGFQIFIQYGPVYLNRVLGMDVKKTGFLAAFPLILAMIAKFMAVPINDRLPWKSERIRINIFSILNVGGMICTIAMLAFLPMINGIPEWLVQIVYASVSIFSGLDFLGVIKCSQHISQKFSPTIMSWETMLSSSTVLLLPPIVSLIAPNNSVHEWAIILFGIAAVQTVTIVLFIIFVNSKPRPWAIKKKFEDQSGGEIGLGKKEIIVPKF